MLAAAMLAVLVAAGGVGGHLGSVVLARHRAQAAADLGALAAAAALPAGPAAACGQAARIAHEMRVERTGCAVRGLDVVVTVQAAVGFTRWDAGPAQATARAGPAARAR